MCVRYFLNCCKHAGSDFKRNNGRRLWCLNLCRRHLEIAKKLLHKILRSRQDVQSILDHTEKWLKRQRMRTLRKNSPGQVEWNGVSIKYQPEIDDLQYWLVQKQETTDKRRPPLSLMYTFVGKKSDRRRRTYRREYHTTFYSTTVSGLNTTSTCRRFRGTGTVGPS